MEDTDEREQLINEKDPTDDPFTPPRTSTRPSIPRGLGIASLMLNLLLLPLLAHQIYLTNHHKWTSYASLTWNHHQHYHHETPYYDKHHYRKSDLAWSNLNTDRGVIALSDTEATRLGLPPAQRFPWDENKGIYHVTAFHQLHCLKLLQRTLSHFRDGGAFTVDDWHGFHCLDNLRQDIQCYADDTPRVTGGEGGAHKCRSWDGLVAWVDERNACYRSVDGIDNTLERYMFCPEGSAYRGKVEGWYGRDVQERILGRWGNGTL